METADVTGLPEVVPKSVVVVDIEDDRPVEILEIPDPSMRLVVELVSWVLSKVASLLEDRSSVVWAGDSVSTADENDERVGFCVSVMPAETSSDWNR